MILYVLSQIWKSGATIERESDGSLLLKNHERINPTVLKAAEPIFPEIDNYLKSVEGMNNVDLTAWKMIVALAGWQNNKSVNDFLNGDEIGLNLFCEYQAKLAGNGWGNIYDDWRIFENAETEKLKIEIFNRAVAFAKGGK